MKGLVVKVLRAFGAIGRGPNNMWITSPDADTIEFFGSVDTYHDDGSWERVSTFKETFSQ